MCTYSKTLEGKILDQIHQCFPPPTFRPQINHAYRILWFYRLYCMVNKLHTASSVHSTSVHCTERTPDGYT